jgi:hypothetical protein
MLMFTLREKVPDEDIDGGVLKQNSTPSSPPADNSMDPNLHLK